MNSIPTPWHCGWAQDITWEVYRTDRRSRRFVERTLHILIEACIDLAQHIISDEHFREPASYRDTFAVLADCGRRKIARIEHRALFTSKIPEILTHLLRPASFEPPLPPILTPGNLKEAGARPLPRSRNQLKYSPTGATPCLHFSLEWDTFQQLLDTC